MFSYTGPSPVLKTLLEAPQTFLDSSPYLGHKDHLWFQGGTCDKEGVLSVLRPGLVSLCEELL